MTHANTLKTLWHLVGARVRGGTHQERLDSFYAGQAAGYDEFRQKLLHGRREMIESLPSVESGVWVDMGAGTGSNAEFRGAALAGYRRVYQVDLCRPLLKLAKQRAAAHGWTNVLPTEADATMFEPPEAADQVTFSYSLTMIPDWFAALENAWRMLKPGGTIGIVDFYVSRKFPAASHAHHSWFTRTFWSTWFALDNVYLSGDHLPFLQRRFELLHLDERRGRVPFLPLLCVPYYVFVGRKL